MDNLRAGTPVQIHLETQITQENESENFVFDMAGQIAYIGDNIYLRYTETSEEEGSIPVTIKIMANGDVKLTRASANRLQLLFSEGKRVSARYQTPYGALAVETVTPMLKVQILENPLRGKLAVDYLLYAGNDLLGKYKIRLQFTI